MNIREAIRDIVVVNCPGGGKSVCDDCNNIIDDLAPKVEAALRAAYDKGYNDGVIEGWTDDDDRGVTAGIEKLTEET